MNNPTLWVLAGTNGAGKSSIGGAMIRAAGGEYFNPDEAARKLQQANPGMAVTAANGEAWQQGVRLLKRAIAEGKNYAFETTLGGTTLCQLLESAAQAGFHVRVWYVGLENVELHIHRVKARVARGGHDIPEDKIRFRFHQSRLNLIHLLPSLSELKLYDNSESADLHAGIAPNIRLLLHYRAGSILTHAPLTTLPDWAKPLFMAIKKIALTNNPQP